MMDEKEKIKISEWALDNTSSDIRNKIFSKKNENMASYYIVKDDLGEDCYFKEIYFQNVPQIKSELDRLWEHEEYMNEIKTTILVAAMKNKERIKNLKSDIETDSQQISDYIYEF